ncbi:MAG: tetraacyldisaccharide 4'-kinase [Pseudomonadota bacterium]
MMKPPSFWNRPPSRPGLLSSLLLPAAAIWASVTRRQLREGPRERLGVPVIAVGNVNLGGTGKTPTVMALVKILQDMDVQAHVVSRGYGGSIDGPHRVNDRRDMATQVGDEPLLLSAFAPVWVAKNRAEGAKAARDAGADVIILDDGLQNAALHHDLTVTVFDAKVGFGNGRVCPAGPLREPVNDALGRTDILLGIGRQEDVDTVLRDWPALRNFPLLSGHLEPLSTGFAWSGVRAYAFAGIGRPQKFFESLRAAGVQLVQTRAFDDHEPYTLAILRRMQAEAWTKDCHLVTTEKDAARIPPDMRAEILTFPVRLTVSQDDILKTMLDGLLRRA